MAGVTLTMNYIASTIHSLPKMILKEVLSERDLSSKVSYILQIYLFIYLCVCVYIHRMFRGHIVT